MNDSIKMFKQLESGDISEKEFVEGLAPGCVYEKSVVRKNRLVPDKPIEHWIKDCKEVHSCDDPSYNIPKTCGEWRKDW